MNNSSEVDWEEWVWKEINQAVVTEVGKVRVAQKVFPTTLFETNPAEIPNNVINFGDLSIKEGQTKQFVEIYYEFPLTATQVTKETMNKICKTLARMAAKAIALAEDAVIFQGQQVFQGQQLSANTNITADFIESAGNGLLGEASPRDADNDKPNKVSESIQVDLNTDRSAVISKI